LKNAVESGASKIAWTNGEQQNERYDLSKQVNFIERIPENDINKEQNDFYLDINLPSGIIGLNVNKDSGIVTRSTGSVYRGDLIDNPLSDVIGKDMADKIMSGGAKKYEGDGLKIGGKGMKGFYGSPKDNSLGILGDLAKSLYKQTPEKLTLDNYREAKLKELQKELDEITANKTADFESRDFHLEQAENETDQEEKEYALSQADYYEKRAKAKAEIEESVLREIKRLGIEYQYSEYLEWLYENNPKISNGFLVDFWHSLKKDIGPKSHTIRAHKKPLKVGEFINPVCWAGKPYNKTKEGFWQIKFAPDIEIKKVWDFEVTTDGSWWLMKIDGVSITHDLEVELAANDGLSFTDLIEWFQLPKKEFSGQIICWNENVKY
jgi:hypothetical protein